MSFSDLPLPSKVVCLCGESDKPPEEHLTDPRLANWEKWMTERKHCNRKIAKALDRHTEQLLCNYSEDLRTIKEEKAVLENTKIIYPHDRYRGNPSFWRLPLALQSKPYQPDYFSVMTSAQKCEIPHMEYVSVPTAIRDEKNSQNVGYRSEKQVWDASPYRQERKLKLKDDIKIVEPFKPDVDLMVKGFSMLTECDACTKPAVAVSECASQTSMFNEILERPPSSIHDKEDYLTMDNCRLCKHLEADVDVHLTFEYDIRTKTLLTKTILVTNQTSYALRYSFTRRKKFQLFHDIVPETPEEQVFFYDKRELIILPYESFELPISFETNFPSTYTLQLEMHLRPKLWEHTFVIHLLAIATYGDLWDECAKIRQRIELEASKVIACETIQDILKDIPIGDDAQAPVFYIYDKPTIFYAVNQTYTPITRHPKYVYSKDIIEELEKFYLKVRLPDNPPFWNLNIEDLRRITKNKQELSYQEKFVDELLTFKDVEDEKKRPKHEVTKGTSSMSRHSSTKLKSKTHTNVDEYKPFGENLIEELEDILLKLQHFTMWFNENKTAYESCYSVMCTAFDALLKEVYQLESDLNIAKIDKYPEQSSYDPHTFEGRIEQVHGDLNGQPPRIMDDFIKGAQPLAECLKDISVQDSIARYQTYYGIVIEDPETKVKKDKGKKDKKEKKEKKEKSNKSDKKKGKGDKLATREKSDISIDVDLQENPNFNIDAQPVVSTTSATSLRASINEESSEITSELLLKEYKRNLYDIFYRNLLESIVKLVDVIEIHKHEQLRSNNIKRMLEETSLKEEPVQMRVVNLKEAIRVALSIPSKYFPVYSNVSDKMETVPPKYEESSHVKEEGSEWSILRSFKMPECPRKPIGYPETNVYLKRKLAKRLYKDIGTIMSNAGIDPNWENFKDAGVQVISKLESRPEKEEHVSNILGNILHGIGSEEIVTKSDSIGEEGIESSLLSTEEMFCCGEIPQVLEKDLETTDGVQGKTT